MTTTIEPPYDLDAERALLGAALLDPRMIGVVAPFNASWFWREAHRHVWRSVSLLYAAGEGVDVLTVANQLDAQGRLQDVGGGEFLVGLLAESPVALNAPHYADIVRGLAATREALNAMREALHALQKNARDAETRFEAISRAATIVMESANRLQPGEERPTLQTMGETFGEIMFELEGASKGEAQPSEFVSTGVAGLEVPVGLLSLVAGAPRTGKSILVKQIVQHWAKHGPKPHVVNIEDRNKHMAHRMLASTTGIEPYRIRQLMQDPLSHPDAQRDYEILMDACARLMGLDGTWRDQQGMTAEMIELECQRAYREDGARAFVVDIASRIEFTPGTGPKALDCTNHIIKVLCRIPARLNVPMVVTLHINREGQKLAKPRLIDLRDSGHWENFARWVVLTHVQNDFLSSSVAHPASLLHEKSTHGPPQGEIPMVLDKPRMEWRPQKLYERMS